MDFRNERGTIILITVYLIVAVLYLSLLVVDITRAKYAVNSIQRSVDAASLAAVTELVLSSETASDRWKNAKRAAFGVLRQNPIFMSSGLPDVADNTTHRGSSDPCETDPTSAYRWQVYENGRIRVEILRGLFDDTANSFASTENSAVCGDTSSPNAVRVTVTIIGFPTIFGGVPPFQAIIMPPLTRTGLGVQL